MPKGHEEVSKIPEHLKRYFNEKFEELGKETHDDQIR